MVIDTARLRATIFERSGIAIDEKDPIMAVLVASAEQSEEIGTRLLRRINPVRVVTACMASAVVFASITSLATWEIARSRADVERAEWARLQSDPRTAALLRSEQGRAALRLAELGVAGLLANCNGRRSWRIQEDYCVPVTADGRPDGFKVAARPRN